MRPIAYTLIDSVRAPRDQVFVTLTDPARIPAWLPGCTGAQSAGPLRRGATLKVSFGARETEFEVVDFAPPQTFGFSERGGRHGWKTFFRLEAIGGSTAVTIRAVWAPDSLIAWLRGRLLERRKVQRQLGQILSRLGASGDAHGGGTRGGDAAASPVAP